MFSFNIIQLFLHISRLGYNTIQSRYANLYISLYYEQWAQIILPMLLHIYMRHSLKRSCKNQFELFSNLDFVVLEMMRNIQFLSKSSLRNWEMTSLRHLKNDRFSATFIL